MESDEDLYKALIEVRDQLRVEGKNATGKSQRVCNDDAIQEMVKLRPKKPEDFYSVPGLGKTFSEKYADRFLIVLNDFAFRDGISTKNIAMNRSVEYALQELEKKLVNISRNNRLLFLPKISNAKEAFDLETLTDTIDPLRIIFERGRRVNLAKAGGKGRDGKRSDNYSKLSQLSRNINRIVREKGQNDLYIGYPFVEGRLPGEKFEVRAPLVLFPVQFIKDPYSVDVKFDDTRDIVYNSTLILAYFKLNKVNKPLPDNIIDEATRDTFIETALAFYAGVGMHITKDGQPCIVKFTNYKANEFPAYNAGELHLVNNMVIGRFPTYSNSIQKDFIEIVDGQMVNPLLDDLLLSMDEKLEDIDKADDFLEKKPNERIPEQDLMYINDLNSAQEEVISLIKNNDKLVIQGPPGTGKSQTISNLIADFASQGKTVLMVSEKKAALDVVYSRLGRLSKYAMLIDDVNNKELFYKQMDLMMHIGTPMYTPDETTGEKSEDIEKRFDELEDIATKIYTPSSFGVEPYKLYLTNKKIDPSDKTQLEHYTAFRDAYYEKMLDYDYPLINSIHDKFKRNSLITDMNDCLDMRAQHPWMMDVKTGLNDYDIEMAKSDLQDLKKEIGSWKTSGFFSKLLGKGKMKNRINEVFEKYWIYYRCYDIMNTYIDIDEYLAGLNYYGEFSSVNNVYEKLSDPEKLYVDVMHKISSNDICSPNMVNDELYNFIILQQINKFENTNKNVLKEIASFEALQNDLKECVAAKKDISKSEIDSNLAGYLSAITASKRYGEMQRVIEMKRRWSVSKYIDKFDFELFKGIKIWLLTPDVVSEIIPMQSGLFDLVIFDEASQMFIEKGIPSVMRAKKVVISGDHKQLRPSKLGAGRIGMDEDDVEDEEDLPIFEEANSLLDVARFKYPNVMLRYHYRSKYEELISFSNHAFYKGRLYVSPNIDSEPDPPIVVHKLDNGKWENRCNRAEAEKVVDLIAEIFKTRRNQETIGVITFNSTQMDLVEELLDERCNNDTEFATVYFDEIRRKENGEDIGLFVKNIENVQGDERDIIIFSIGYAEGDNGRIVRNFGWLNQAGGENRLNVAISRAKKKIHIVTSFNPSDLVVEDVKNDGPKLLKRYLQYCFAVSECNRTLIDSILKSLDETEEVPEYAGYDDRFGETVYQALIKRGFDVEKGIGIGGYSIDMAIRKNGRYVLGIECDGRLYHSQMDARERDFHRQMYMESRGWKLYRVWSPNWWKSPQSELDKIADLVEKLN